MEPPLRSSPQASRVRQELFEPVHDLLFDVDRGVIATGAAGVHRRGEGVCENPHDRRRRVDPAEEAGMTVTERVRLDGQTKEVENLVGINAGPWSGVSRNRPARSCGTG